MLTTVEFFEAFDEAGFLKPASWTPSFGGGPFEPKVRYHGPSTIVGADGGVRVVDHSITFPTSQLPGLKEGEILTVDGISYRVRVKPEAELDGTLMRAELGKVVP